MGPSLTSALISLGMVIAGLTVLVLWKRRKAAVLLVAAGLALVVLPNGLTYLFLD